MTLSKVYSVYLESVTSKADSLVLSSSVYTKDETDSLYAKKLATYTKTESDEKYALKDASYTKTASDAKYALKDASYTHTLTATEATRLRVPPLTPLH